MNGLALALLLLPGTLFQDGVPARPAPAAADVYLAAAKEAARWIRSTGVRTDIGLVWPADPEDTRSAPSNLYSGSAGVVLFLLELQRATGDAALLEEARDGARFLARSLPAEPLGEEGSAFYTGVAGIGFVLAEAHRVGGDEEFRTGAHRCVERLRAAVREAEGGVEWNDTTDIIRGGAGTGLFLLYAARALELPEARDLAVRAGTRLLALAREAPGGLSWPMTPEYPRVMPNFSHGTAGVAFFLARLYEETGEQRFLEAAVAGARSLGALAQGGEHAGLVHHHEPGGEDLFYLGWCHGPPGTARLFHQLARVTGDEAWSQWLWTSAATLMRSGVPAERTPGLWNNAGQCCGDAGVAEFFLELHRLSGKDEYLDFARELADAVLARATRDERGLSWAHAEHRVRPDQLVAQTGYMQGAAGIGMMLLHLHHALQGGGDWLRLPDSPFAGP